MKEQKRLSVSQNALYNMVGSIFYCFCQWVISALIIVHLSPSVNSESNKSLLQLAISITNIFYSISIYNMRTYQISDTKNQYSNGDYIGLRFVTAAVSVGFCAIYIVACGYSAKDILCIMAYMVYKLSETFSDVLHGIDQKNYRMDYVGISFIIRGVLSVASFTVTLLATGDVVLSVIAMAITTLLAVLFYDVRCTSRLGDIKPRFNKQIIGTLLIVCLPTVISTASFTAITTVPRQMLEAVHKGALGYYGTIATPLVVIQVMATSIFNPTLTQLSEYYNGGKSKKLIKQLFKDFAIVALIACVAFVAIAVLGEFAVGLVFGQEYVQYTYLMYGIVGCTVLYVISWLTKNVLIIMRKLKTCMVASLVALPISVVLSRPFIKLFYMNGVSYCIMVAYLIHITICLSVLLKTLRQEENKMKYNSNNHTYALCAYKESEFLEECVKSLLSQTVKSNILIATSTPNEHINSVAEKYQIPVYINEGEKGIGGDWNFAYSKANTPLITIAHQDDIYEPEYTEQMLECVNSSKEPIIYFSGYGELRNGEKVYNNSILKVKKLMLSPLKIKSFWTSRFIRRRILSMGNCICCPAVTYVKERVGEKPFTNDYLSNIDWQQWEILSRKKGSFVYDKQPLMCHRIHEQSTTTEIIGDSKRTIEDLDMFCKFWPRPIAKFIAKIYSKSEKSNNV